MLKRKRRRRSKSTARLLIEFKRRKLYRQISLHAFRDRTRITLKRCQDISTNASIRIESMSEPSRKSLEMSSARKLVRRLSLMVTQSITLAFASVTRLNSCLQSQDEALLQTV